MQTLNQLGGKHGVGRVDMVEKVHLRSRWWPVLADADDEAMVHLAVESRTKYLVTHNVRHLQPAVEVGVSVVTPREFFRTLRGRL